MAYRSGRKKRVMIACVTFETVKVTDPVRYYECSKVHIIHYTKETSDKKTMFSEFYDRVCEIIRENDPKAEIVEHNGSVNNFTGMLSVILSIIEQEQKEGDCEIFVNISAGSPEYSAAAAISSMMSEGVIPFSVNSRSYSVQSEEEIREAYYKDNVPVGLTSETYDPRMLPTYHIDKPPEYLVRGLRLLDERNGSRLRTKSTDMAPALKENGIWFRDETEKGKKQSDAVHYHRDYVSKWLEYGWAEKDELRKKLKLTDEGRNVIDTFFID